MELLALTAKLTSNLKQLHPTTSSSCPTKVITTFVLNFRLHISPTLIHKFKMSLSSKLSITDVDVKDKRVLIRVCTSCQSSSLHVEYQH